MMEMAKSGKKPAIIESYNKSKYGVDQFDEMVKSFSFSPITRRWPVKV